jgi:subtilase family serine protease
MIKSWLSLQIIKKYKKREKKQVYLRNLLSKNSKLSHKNYKNKQIQNVFL